MSRGTEGTEIQIVIFFSAIKRVGRKEARDGRQQRVAPLDQAENMHLTLGSKVSSKACEKRSFSLKSYIPLMEWINAERFLWLTGTPLGSPVLPEGNRRSS